jgi:hypothetical protein
MRGAQHTREHQRDREHRRQREHRTRRQRERGREREQGDRERQQAHRREGQSPLSRAAEHVARHAILAVHRVQGPAAAQVQQGDRRRHAARQHPTDEREQQRPPRDDRARAERERLREIVRGLVKNAQRQRIAAQQPRQRGDDAQAEGLEDQHLHDRRAPRPDQAQVRDRPASLGNRQQQRVEREQQAQQRADRGEERARLVAGVQRPVQRRDILIGRRDLQAPPRQRLQPRARRGLRTGLGLHQDPRDPAPQSRELLQAPQRHHGHARLRERAERFRAQHRRDPQPIRSPAQRQRHRGPLRGLRAGGRDRVMGERLDVGLLSRDADRFRARLREA